MNRVRFRGSRTAGTSLIEVLVVIVVFLVGILALVQIFPPGLAALRTTRNNTLGNSLARSETQRILGQGAQVPEMITPVNFLGGSAFISINNNVSPEELKPPMDNPAANTGLIDNTGQVVVGGNQIGRWDRVSGANVFSRVIGEGSPVPSARFIQPGNALYYGGLMQLLFAPMYYSVDPATGVGVAGLVLAYGNDLVRSEGNLNAQPAPIPSPLDAGVKDWNYYYVHGEDATNGATTPFVKDDQIWIGRTLSGGVVTDSSYRISFSFQYPDAVSGVRQYDVVALVRPTDAAVYSDFVANSSYTVISLRQLVALSNNVYGGSGGFLPANYLGTDEASVRVERVFNEVKVTDAWDTTNPYQYKVVSANLGTLLFNPVGSTYRVTTASGEVPLSARVDYTVYDWRIIKDDFVIPNGIPNNSKLILNQVRSANTHVADGTLYTGLGGAGGADKSLWIPDASGTVQNQDFILEDLQTGGVILGNLPGDPHNAWTVDKSNGIITFTDVDGDMTNGLSGYLALPTGDPANPWSVGATPIQIGGRIVRALYRGSQEFAVQALKSASNYRVTVPATPLALGPGECAVGTAATFGQPNRLYFSLSDLGQKVTIGEAWTTGGVLRDRDYQIVPPDNTGLPYVQLPGGVNFDFTANGYAVTRVKGASLRVRVLWNPSSFTLGSDQAANFNNMMLWAQQWRRIETDSFEAGAPNP